tara:strand:+ start:824 stop:1000 length:177 start_codon:yes stop_codon:yes gene_type:complete
MVPKNNSSKNRVNKTDKYYGVKKNKPRSRPIIKSLIKKNKLKLRNIDHESESNKTNNE